MASVTSVRSHVDQENSQPAFRVKNGRSFGPAKTFHSNAPLATPRRALGDVGNTLKTPGSLTKKTSLLKSNRKQNLLQPKTPRTKRISNATPLGKGLSKQAVPLSSKYNRKQAFQVRGDVQSVSESKNSISGRDCFKKENMIPFTDDEKPLPRGPAINTILSNVSELYRGCLDPVPKTSLNIGIDVLRTETVTRPETECNWFGMDDLGDLNSNISSSLEDFELPPIDTDLSGLGLP